ncbi:MAG: hypothetical protein WAV00_21025 [Nocardioides sp.]
MAHAPQPPDRNEAGSSGAAAPTDALERLAAHREPAVSIDLPRAGGLTAWSETFSRGRILAAAGLTPLLFLVYGGLIDGGPPPGPGWTAVLLGVAAIGSLALATYLPQPGTGALTSPCAAVAGVWVFFAGMALNAPPDPVNGLIAFGAVTFALVQRVRGAHAC